MECRVSQQRGCSTYTSMRQTPHRSLRRIGNKTIDEQVSFGFNATATDADLNGDGTPANNLTFSLTGATLWSIDHAGRCIQLDPGRRTGAGKLHLHRQGDGRWFTQLVG